MLGRGIVSEIMNTITIPRNLIKNDDLVIIPRKEYDSLLAWKAEKQEVKAERSASFRIPKKHERFYEKLDQGLTECLKSCGKGDLSGKFSSVAEMRKSLEK